MKNRRNILKSRMVHVRVPHTILTVYVYLMKYPFSIDSIARAIFSGRLWILSILIALSWISHYYIAYSLIGVFALTETFVQYNKWHLLPTSRLPEFNENDAALITGGLQGLGLEIVKQLLELRKFGKVFILDVRNLAEQLSDDVVYVKCDLSSAKALNSGLDSVYSLLDQRRLSLVVNNAGVRESGSLLNMRNEDTRRVFEVNTFSVITILKEVVSHHLKNDLLHRLSIANISSVLGTFGPKNLLIYSASKASTIQIHESFAEEMREYPRIRPLLVLPGQLTTEMFSDVSPSCLFFAPLVDHRQLARLIVQNLQQGKTGVLCEPLYTNLLPVMKVMPLFVQRIARWVSQMDDKLNE